jgi:glycosyltransferase involved in cell wall biosynthesis
MSSRPKVTIISTDPLTHDARVQRQIKYLSEHFDVQVITNEQLDGPIEPIASKLGSDTDLVLPRVQVSQKVKALLQKSPLRFAFAERLYGVLRNLVDQFRKVRRPLLRVAGKVFGGWAYEAWYWDHFYYRKALAHLLANPADVIHVNNWNALPAAVKAAEKTGARLIVDLHEYSPLQFDNRPLWRMFELPMVDYFLRKNIPKTAGTITVSEGIAEKYWREYGFRPVVVMNAPASPQKPPFKPTNPDEIQLIHHGVALRDRRLEFMIEAVSLAALRYSLHFMLVEYHPGYIEELQALAERIAPGRVFFHPPVKPTEIVMRLGAFDMGIFILPGVNFNYEHALPNKFFDFINAGLAVCISPSREMARYTQQYGFGVVTPSVNPPDVAKVLNELTAEQVDQMKRRAIEARKVLNADVEMGKLVNLYRQVLSKR